jgi:transposase
LGEKSQKKKYFALDITAVSSYSELLSSVRYGYNRDSESLPQINFSMPVGEKSGLPVYYERYPGNIHDIITLKRDMKTLDWLQADHIHLVMEKDSAV